MIKTQMKSFLLNKSNLIYTIVGIIIFILLNLSINLGNIVDSYYDNTLESYISSISDESNPYSKRSVIEESYRKILISNGEAKIEEIRNALSGEKYVEDVFTQRVDFSTEEQPLYYDFIYVKVDNWKNCSHVKKYLDSKGIETSYCADSTFYDKYETTKNYAYVIEITSIIIAFVIFIVICNNIIKNEKKNLQLLNVIGYKKSQIRKITFCGLLLILLISGIIGIILSRIVILAITKSLNLKLYENIAMEILINIIIIILPISICLYRGIKKSKQ